MSFDSIDAPSGEFIAHALVLNTAIFATCSLTVARGAGVTLWHGADVAADTSQHCQLRLAPDRPAIIGRSNGYKVPYLDPSYQATQLVPGTGQNIMREDGHGRDGGVSRAHFMLRAASRGVLLVNGVPRPGGGLRTPLNGTRLLVPEQRWMTAGEEYLVESGATAMIGLPNGSSVQISAE